MLYVKVYGAVADAPVKVTNGDVEFLHTAIVPVMVAVGKGLTVMGFFSSGPKPHALCPFTRIVSDNAAIL
jgi:hypothetical protein